MNALGYLCTDSNSSKFVWVFEHDNLGGLYGTSFDWRMSI